MSRSETELHGEPVGVLIVDDSQPFRRAAREVVEAAAPDFVLLGEATSGEGALAQMDVLRPDLVFLDVRMRELDGIETAKRMHAAHPEAIVVLVTTEQPLNLPAAVGFCGAADLVRKQDLRPSLLRRLWRAHGSAVRS